MKVVQRALERIEKFGIIMVENVMERAEEAQSNVLSPFSLSAETSRHYYIHLFVCDDDDLNHRHTWNMTFFPIRAKP